MTKKTIGEKLEENQTVEKSALIVAGTTLLSAGLGFMEKNIPAAITLIVLGVACLVGREILKLKN
jgi:hypothetical protein